ncbi:uncharacterized protein Bfra_009758 [Botrytis fragariae]|uniref:Uncharacterized protein n=1 Tax=Botrytis fragariae TaxID=1964551 RepID=A0A8H6EFE6_9HELO|nr:uncharacterized protein Bfra_009758 [Botrytis fragariae]KAF5870374.1 hypothetical protein Bfra_009758 [Botrytis fragariae]
MFVPFYSSLTKIFDTYKSQTPQDSQRKQTDAIYHLLGSISLNDEDIKLFGEDCVESIKPKVKKQVDMMKLVGHRDTLTHEKIITNNPSLHEKKNLTFKETLEEMRADTKETKRVLDQTIESLEIEKMKIEGLEREKIKIERKIERLEREKVSRYEGETANMRRQLWIIACTKKDPKQQIPEPMWMKSARKRRNHLAHQTDLETVMKLADDYPKVYDILLETVYGVPKNEIKLLLDADKTGGNQVYNILNDRGSAFHNRYANTCVEPFNLWLSAVRSLQETQSATAKKPSSDYESCVQKQKAEVQKSIREWDAAFKVDKLKRDTKTKKCQRMIYKDYEDRDLFPRIWESFGVEWK